MSNKAAFITGFIIGDLALLVVYGMFEFIIWCNTGHFY